MLLVFDSRSPAPCAGVAIVVSGTSRFRSSRHSDQAVTCACLAPGLRILEIELSDLYSACKLADVT